MLEMNSDQFNSLTITKFRNSGSEFGNFRTLERT